jgi:hypothetical protein
MTSRQDEIDAVTRKLDAVIGSTGGPANAPNAMGLIADLAKAVRDLAAIIERWNLRTSPPPSGEAGEARDLALEEAALAVERDPMRHHFPSTIAAAATRVRALKSALPTIKEPTDGK